MSLANELKEARAGIGTILAGVNGPESGDWKEALVSAQKGMSDLQELLAALQAGDKARVEASLSEFEDVNRTYEAIAKMDLAIAAARSKVKIEDVAKFISIGLKVAVKVAALL